MGAHADRQRILALSSCIWPLEHLQQLPLAPKNRVFFFCAKTIVRSKIEYQKIATVFRCLKLGQKNIYSFNPIRIYILKQINIKIISNESKTNTTQRIVNYYTLHQVSTKFMFKLIKDTTRNTKFIIYNKIDCSERGRTDAASQHAVIFCLGVGRARRPNLFCRSRLATLKFAAQRANFLGCQKIG